MRWIAFVLVVSACSVDNFQFATAPDLAHGPADLGAVVSDGGEGGQLGKPCTAASCAAIWSCFPDPVWPAGFCSATCDPTDPTFCRLDGDCKTFGGQSVCLPKCNPKLGILCRIDYHCCTGSGNTGDVGNCAPQDSKFCGN